MTRRHFASLTAVVVMALAAVSASSAPASAPQELKFRINGAHLMIGSVQFKDGKLSCEKPGNSRQLAQPSEEAWKQFRAELDELKVWRWRPSYANTNVLDGADWSLSIQYEDAAVRSVGSNEYPDANGSPSGSAAYSASFNQLRAALMKLAAGCRL